MQAFGLFKTMGFRQRLFLALGSLSVLVLAVALVAFFTLQSIRRTSRAAANDRAMSILASEISIHALQCRRYEKDFLLNAGDITAQDAPLQQWHAASFELGKSIKAFEDAASSELDQAQAQVWREAWRDYVRGFSSVEIAVNEGSINDTQAAVKTFEAAQNNIQILTDQSYDLAEVKNHASQASSAELDLAGQQAIMRLTIISSVIVLLALLTSWRFPRWLIKPIQKLQTSAERLASGDLSARTGLRLNDEIGMLGRSFDQMAQTLEQNTNDLANEYIVAQTAREEAESARSQIEHQLFMIQQQAQVIAEMSTPILPLTSHALVMPLVGALDQQRIQQAQARALEAIQARRAKYLLLDITAVPVIDTQVGQSLLHLLRAAHLLGCSLMLVGVRPDVAQTIVGLGIDLGDIATCSSLQSGIDRVLNR